MGEILLFLFARYLAPLGAIIILILGVRALWEEEALKDKLIAFVLFFLISIVFIFVAVTEWGNVWLHNSVKVTYHPNSQIHTVCRARDDECDGWFMSTYSGLRYSGKYSFRGGNTIFRGTAKDIYSCTYPQALGIINNGKREGYWKFWTRKRSIDEELSGFYKNDIKVAPFDSEQFIPAREQWEWPAVVQEMVGLPVPTTSEGFKLDSTQPDYDYFERTSGNSTCYARLRSPW